MIIVVVIIISSSIVFIPVDFWDYIKTIKMKCVNID